MVIIMLGKVKRLCSVLCSNIIALDSSATRHLALCDHDAIRKKIIDPFCKGTYILAQTNFNLSMSHNPNQYRSLISFLILTSQCRFKSL